MALPLLYSAHRLGSSAAPNLLEFFVDLDCPFSARLFKRLTNEVLPWLNQHHPNKVQCIFRHQVQPWHPQSSLMHEASLAVERIHPDAFIPYVTSVFEHQSALSDAATINMTRAQIYAQLAQYLPSGITHQQFHALLDIGEHARNDGNAMTADLKWHIKYARQLGVHVSPTVYWNGLVENAISSGWTLEQWQEWLNKQLAC